MQTHVKILAIIHIVFGAMCIFLGLGFFALIGGIAGLTQTGQDPNGFLVVMGALTGFILLALMAFSLPGIIAGIGLLSYQPWARIVAIILSGLNLVNFPIGTLLGGYGLWVLLTAEGARLFEQPSVLPPEERNLKW